MASFTDSPQTFFSQATPMVDLNLYGQTLDYKQAQYNQGAQRIQGSIDKIAGLDILHPLAKDYLHTKLTDLGSKVNQLAGGDFSNQSLVSQAMALAPKVAKDEKIQTAVLSTQQIRALSASQKKLYDKDPSLYPSSMRWMDNQAVSNYLASDDLEKGYHGASEATKYKDYHKDLDTLVKQIVPDVKWEIGPDGKYQMKTNKYSKVTNDRIQATINGYLASSPEAYKSMTADALFTYKDASREFMASHLNETYDRNINALAKINEEYEKQIKANPGDRDFANDRRAAITANVKTIEEMKGNKSLYTHYLSDPSKFDEVKRTIYADNLKGMFSSVFQKDDIERTISENHNAVNADKHMIDMANYQLKAAEYETTKEEKKRLAIVNGFEPVPDKYGNPIILTPASKYWPRYLHELDEQRKKDKANNPDGETPFGGTPDIVGTDPTSVYGSTELLHKQVGDLTTSINETANKFFTNWRLGKEFKNDADARAQFNSFMTKQQELFDAGSPTTTPEYREYRRATQDNELLIGAYDQLSEKALDYAQKNNKITGKNAELFTALRDIMDNFNADPNNSFFSENIKQSEYSKANMRRLLDKYKNKPFYNELIAYDNTEQAKSSFARNPNFVGKTALDNIMIMHQKWNEHSTLFTSNTNARRKDVEDYIKKHEQAFAPEQYNFVGKEQERKAFQGEIGSLLAQKGGISDTNEEYDLKKVTSEDIQVLGASQTADGRVRFSYQVKGHKPDFITTTQAGGVKILPVDPDARLKRIISITGSTPITGRGVLTSNNGLIRYRIKQSPLDPNQYDAEMIDKGTPIPIASYGPDGETFHSLSPSQIKTTFEEFSKLPSRTNPKVRMTREECYDRLTLPQDQYEAKYPKPKTNQ